eukprot:Awhi_evm1s4666
MIVRFWVKTEFSNIQIGHEFYAYNRDIFGGFFTAPVPATDPIQIQRSLFWDSEIEALLNFNPRNGRHLLRAPEPSRFEKETNWVKNF